jgi:hypothetical protein
MTTDSVGGRARRVLAAVVVTCAVGAAATLLATGRTWAVVVVDRPAPLPDEHLAQSGGELLPWLPALGWLALAGAGALIATRGVLRRAAGGMLALAGTGIVAGAGWAAVSEGIAAGWPALAGLGGVAIMAVGLLAVGRGRSWPVMGARYDRRAAPPSVAAGEPAPGSTTRPEQMWQALDRGEDPTR